jgi:hypothetical protein
VEFQIALDFFARYIWPLLLAWNVYLWRCTQRNWRDLYCFRLHVAENFAAKRDLEKLLTDFEARIDKRFDQLISTLNIKQL